MANTPAKPDAYAPDQIIAPEIVGLNMKNYHNWYFLGLTS